MSETAFAGSRRSSAEETMVVTISERAQTEIREIAVRENAGAEVGLRLGVIGGGCSGLSYQMELGARREHDHVQMLGSLPVYIDPKSAVYLKGTTLDFDGGLNGRGFVFSNPNARNTCGCGESFSI
jgi:iron-sulfur cluster assembly protein